ncbi:MAG: DUF4886 domain-containing protein [Muribaculaceae bacterium]|nr:DUF4886 domain-containing protein [Muribaculaceae bacterium]
MYIRNIALSLMVLLTLFCCPTATYAAGESDIVRILAVGNSFSEDALDYYFHDICKAAGKNVIVGNLYIGGCSIDRHLLNAQTDSAAYRFRRIGLDGATLTTSPVRMSEALGSDDWDYVSLQQASGVSGIYSSYAHLGELIAYVDSLTSEKTRLIWHQTWAYSPTSDHGEYSNYASDQHVMYDSIVSACARAMAEHKALALVVPVGTAVQNARHAGGNPDLTRDGYHLDVIIGRYIAACTWFEAIFGEAVTGNSFVPAGLSPELAEMAQEAAHAACISPMQPSR